MELMSRFKFIQSGSHISQTGTMLFFLFLFGRAEPAAKLVLLQMNRH